MDYHLRRQSLRNAQGYGKFVSGYDGHSQYKTERLMIRGPAGTATMVPDSLRSIRKDIKKRWQRARSASLFLRCLWLCRAAQASRLRGSGLCGRRLRSMPLPISDGGDDLGRNWLFLMAADQADQLRSTIVSMSQRLIAKRYTSRAGSPPSRLGRRRA